MPSDSTPASGRHWQGRVHASSVYRYPEHNQFGKVDDMSGQWQDPDAISLMLDELETWAIVGLSENRSRDAYRIAQLLQSRGKKVIPIHPQAPTVLGEPGYADLAEVGAAIDVVDVFRRSADAGAYADQAVQVGAKAVWFQLGVVDEAAFERTTGAGLAMVMDTCPAIEWGRRN